MKAISLSFFVVVHSVIPNGCKVVTVSASNPSNVRKIWVALAERRLAAWTRCSDCQLLASESDRGAQTARRVRDSVSGAQHSTSANNKL